MFVLLNGAFGVGKTTVAKLLASEIADARLYDPEIVGFVINRVPPWMMGRSGRVDDYQDLAAWRRSIVYGARWAHRRSSVVIIPMAFSNLAYLEELDRALAATAPVRRLCLVAPLQVVEERLFERARAARQPPNQWALRRAAECCLVHRSLKFGEPIDARPPVPQVVADARRRIGR